jgi:hypothetical protein
MNLAGVLDREPEGKVLLSFPGRPVPVMAA